jgi:hypothetical protein
MLAWGMVLLTAPLSPRQPRRAAINSLMWFAGALLLAMSVLVRPGAMGLPVVLGVLSALVNRRAAESYHRRWRLPVGATMLLLTILVLLPWAIRNHHVLGRWIWTSTNAGVTAYDGFNPDAAAKSWPRLGESDQRFIAEMPQLRRMSEIERNDYLNAKARDFMRRDWRRTARLALAKVARTWSPIPLSEQFGRSSYRAIALAYAIPFDVLVVLGLWLGPLPRTAKLFLMTPALYLTVAAALSVGSLRYRMPAEVPMAVLAAGLALRTPQFKRPDVASAG